MSAPPENIKPSDLYAALVAVPRPHRIIDFPRKDPRTGEPVGRLAMWVLTQQEHMAASADADRWAKRILKDQQKTGEANLGYESVYNNEGAVQLLFRACRDAGDLNRAAFPTVEALRQSLTADEVAVLLSAYFQMTSEVGPIVGAMTKEDVDAWLDKLERGGLEGFPFYLLSSEAKNDLITSLAERYLSSRTDNSSSGSPPDDGISETAESNEECPT